MNNSQVNGKYKTVQNYPTQKVKITTTNNPQVNVPLYYQSTINPNQYSQQSFINGYSNQNPIYNLPIQEKTVTQAIQYSTPNQVNSQRIQQINETIVKNQFDEVTYPSETDFTTISTQKKTFQYPYTKENLIRSMHTNIMDRKLIHEEDIIQEDTVNQQMVPVTKHIKRVYKIPHKSEFVLTEQYLLEQMALLWKKKCIIQMKKSIII